MTDRSADFAGATRDALVRELARLPATGRGERELPGRVRELIARVAFDEMYQFVSLCLPDGTLLDVNQPALDAGGVRREDVIGRPFWDARWWTVSPGTQDALRAAFARAAAGEFVRYEADVWAGAGGREIVTVDFSLRPVRDGTGAVVFVIPEGRDISAKKRADAELARKNDELRTLYDRVREADELKTRFFANVSHELRTPLALVLGPVERLLSGGGLDADGRAALEVVERNARTAVKHVNDLLDLARIEAGRAAPDYASTDLARLVRLTAAHFEALARERRIDFQVDAPPLEAEIDPGQLERIVLNLVANAFKFAPDAGRVRVTLSREGGEARLEVADSGPGIPPELREAVFERFRQLDAGLARVPGGIGLGLAIARDFAEQHGGRIAVRDAREGGALLEVFLPLAAPERARVRREPSAPTDRDRARAVAGALRAPPPPARVEVAGDRPLVLVVEDNPEMNDFLRAALAPDWRTAAAHGGAEGLRLALELRPDLVLADVMMPGGGGDELLRTVRARPELAGVPVVLLTAKADEALRARLLAEGAADYVTKPVAVPELRARISNLVAMKRARDVLQAELVEQAEDVGRLAEEVARRKRELQTALDAMRFAREEAERASAQKTSLMHLVSHELRTPLSSLLLQLERLRRDAASLTPQHAHVVSRMRGSTLRLVDLVESLLEFERIESGRFLAAVEPVDLGGVAAEVIEEVRPQAEQKCLALELSAPADLPLLESDPRLVRVVLLNLVSNGLKFTSAGGVTVALAAGGGAHRVTVRDTGRGISAEDQGRIFEPFEQLEALARKHTPGIGLGLTLVREVVQALGGEISVESAPGEGSAFTVSLPSRATAPAPAPE